jgi:hypothetical protein
LYCSFIRNGSWTFCKGALESILTPSDNALAYIELADLVSLLPGARQVVSENGRFSAQLLRA